MLNLSSEQKKIYFLNLSLVAVISLCENESAAGAEVTPSQAIVVDDYEFFQTEIIEKKSISRQIIYSDRERLGAENRRDSLNIKFNVVNARPKDRVVFLSKRSLTIDTAIDDQGRNLLDLQKARGNPPTGLVDQGCPGPLPSDPDKTMKSCNVFLMISNPYIWQDVRQPYAKPPKKFNFDTSLELTIFSDSKILKKLKGFQELALRGKEIFSKKFMSDWRDQRVKHGGIEIDIQSVSLQKTSAQPQGVEIEVKGAVTKPKPSVGSLHYPLGGMFTIKDSQDSETDWGPIVNSQMNGDFRIRFMFRDSKPPYNLIVRMPEIKKIPIELNDVVIPR